MKQNERLRSGETVWFGEGCVRIFIFLSFFFSCPFSLLIPCVCVFVYISSKRRSDRKKASDASKWDSLFLFTETLSRAMATLLTSFCLNTLTCFIRDRNPFAFFMYINKKREHFVWAMCTSLRLIVGCMGYDCFDVNVPCTIRICTALGKDGEREKK